MLTICYTHRFSEKLIFGLHAAYYLKLKKTEISYSECNSRNTGK